MFVIQNGGVSPLSATLLIKQKDFVRIYWIRSDRRQFNLFSTYVSAYICSTTLFENDIVISLLQIIIYNYNFPFPIIRPHDLFDDKRSINSSFVKWMIASILYIYYPHAFHPIQTKNVLSSSTTTTYQHRRVDYLLPFITHDWFNFFTAVLFSTIQRFLRKKNLLNWHIYFLKCIWELYQQWFDRTW